MNNTFSPQEVSIMVHRLDSTMLDDTQVITWGSPVPSFGNVVQAQIATLGLNPSNREFVDEKGKELDGALRRFHSLKSLGLSGWAQAKTTHLSAIVDLCNNYFYRNPYDGWFKRLDNIISGTGRSYYFPSGQACHLDLIPYATACKWVDLAPSQRKKLLDASSDTLGMLLRRSSVKVLILNGQTVVENLQRISNVQLHKTGVSEWTLPRKEQGVSGYAYTGMISELGGISLNREIAVLGYNHNLQSSYGVTSAVQQLIRNWISNSTKGIL